MELLAWWSVGVVTAALAEWRHHRRGGDTTVCGLAISAAMSLLGPVFTAIWLLVEALLAISNARCKILIKGRRS